MKYYAAILLLAPYAFGQQQQHSNSTYTYDVNGHPVPGSTISDSAAPGSDRKSTTVRSLNGRSVPVESVEERVVSNSGGVKVVERLVRHYDANGIPGPPEKIHIEERKNADGSGTIATTVMRSDINGNYALTERSNTDVRKSGDTTTSTTSIERPTLNGALDVVEKREETRRETPGGDVTANATTYQRDSNGRMYEAAREDVSQTKKNNALEENAALYEATNGQLQLVKQTVSRTVKTGDSSLTEMQVFSPEIAGRAPTPGSKPQLKEEKIIESRPTATGAVATTSIRSTSPNAPGQLGPARKVEETVCTGSCK